MENKILVDDVLARMEGGDEISIDPKTPIRFELAKGKVFRVSIQGQGLVIQETGSGPESGSIIILPKASNAVAIL